MPLFWFVSSTNGIKRRRDKTFCFDIQLEPNPRTQHTQLCRITWDLYLSVRSPTNVTRETSNDRFTIQGRSLPIASKRWVTHYPKVTKKGKKNGQRPQPSTKQIRYSYELKGYIFVVPIWGFCLKFLWVALASGWFLSLSQSLLFWMTLAFVSIYSILGGLSLNSGVHVQFWEGYVLKFCILLFSSGLGDSCLHIQFSKDMCTRMMVILNGKLT